MSKQSKKATIKKMTDVYNELWSESWSVFNTLTTFENMLPPFPSDKWSFRGKAEEHVIVFDASGVKKGEIPEKDLHYLLQMYELDYVAVITKNVVGQELLNHHTLDPLFLLTAAVAEQKAECRFEVMKKPHEIGKGGAGLMDVYYETGDYHLNDVDDEDNFVSGSDFAAFLKKQIAHHERDPEKRKAKEAVKNVKLNQLDLNTTTVYLKDLFLPSSGAELDAKMKHEIKLPTVPHGDYCMMQSVRQSASLDSIHSKCRYSVCYSLSLLTFKFPADMLQVMGLGFLTYGGGSKFHEDARGQMDSGHICLKGYNHVVILRRLESDDVKGFQSMLTVAEKRDIQNSDEPVGTTVLHTV